MSTLHNNLVAVSLSRPNADMGSDVMTRRYAYSGARRSSLQERRTPQSDTMNMDTLPSLTKRRSRSAKVPLYPSLHDIEDRIESPVAGLDLSLGQARTQDNNQSSVSSGLCGENIATPTENITEGGKDETLDSNPEFSKSDSPLDDPLKVDEVADYEDIPMDDEWSVFGSVPSDNEQTGLKDDSVATKVKNVSTDTPKGTNLDITNVQPSRPQIVCQCCFDDIPQSDYTWVTCSSVDKEISSDRHAFCADCIRRYAQEFVFGGQSYSLVKVTTDGMKARHHLPCMSPDCQKHGYITEQAVEQIVTERVWEQYTEKMGRISVVRTQSLPPIAMSGELARSHGPSRSRVRSTVDPPARPLPTRATSPKERRKSSALDDSYHRAEEALTNAKVRRCPVCYTTFLKEENSCNKIRCPSCRYCMCYSCRKPLPAKGYEHFCNHQTDKACEVCLNSTTDRRTCVLWSGDDEEVDAVRLRQVATEVANQLWEESLLNSRRGSSRASSHNNTRSIVDESESGYDFGGDEDSAGSSSGEVEEIRIDIERLLKDPSVSATTAATTNTADDTSTSGLVSI